MELQYVCVFIKLKFLTVQYTYSIYVYIFLNKHFKYEYCFIEIFILINNLCRLYVLENWMKWSEMVIFLLSIAFFFLLFSILNQYNPNSMRRKLKWNSIMVFWKAFCDFAVTANIISDKKKRKIFFFDKNAFTLWVLINHRKPAVYKQILKFNYKYWSGQLTAFDEQFNRFIELQHVGFERVYYNAYIEWSFCVELRWFAIEHEHFDYLFNLWAFVLQQVT